MTTRLNNAIEGSQAADRFALGSQELADSG